MRIITIKKTKDSKLESVFSSNDNQEAFDKAEELRSSTYLVQVHELTRPIKRWFNEDVKVVKKKTAKKTSKKKSDGDAE